MVWCDGMVWYGMMIWYGMVWDRSKQIFLVKLTIRLIPTPFGDEEPRSRLGR